MKETEKILKLAQKNNGIITSQDIVLHGYSRGILKHLVDTGRLEKASRGVYCLPEAWEDEFINLQGRYKRGIFSLDTALYLNDLTDRTPNIFYMTFPNSYNVSGPKSDGIICHSVNSDVYELGVTEILTPDGHRVQSYNAERTLCDILKPKNHTDIQLVTNAFKRYVTRADKNIPLLSEYAKKLKVDQKVRTYLEVLL